MRDLFDAQIQHLRVQGLGRWIQIDLHWVEEVMVWRQSTEKHFSQALTFLMLLTMLEVGDLFQQLSTLFSNSCSTPIKQMSTSKKWFMRFTLCPYLRIGAMIGSKGEINRTAMAIL
jgi:hypothetical protein